MLAVFAAGSMTSGFLYGARHWRAGQARRFATAVVLLALGVCLFLLVRSLGALAGTMFVVGFAISPSIIAGNGLMQELVPASRLTEGLTWIGTAITFGASVGSAAAGARIDDAGSHGGFLLIVAVALAVVATVALAYPALRRAGAQPAHDEVSSPVAATATEV